MQIQKTLQAYVTTLPDTLVLWTAEDAGARNQKRTYRLFVAEAQRRGLVGAY